jgi:hypothetical protein
MIFQKTEAWRVVAAACSDGFLDINLSIASDFRLKIRFEIGALPA